MLFLRVGSRGAVMVTECHWIRDVIVAARHGKEETGRRGRSLSPSFGVPPRSRGEHRAGEGHIRAPQQLQHGLDVRVDVGRLLSARRTSAEVADSAARTAAPGLDAAAAEPGGDAFVLRLAVSLDDQEPSGVRAHFNFL